MKCSRDILLFVQDVIGFLESVCRCFGKVSKCGVALLDVAAKRGKPCAQKRFDLRFCHRAYLLMS